MSGRSTAGRAAGEASVQCGAIAARLVVGVGVAVVVATVFLPSLANDFAYDDTINIEKNAHLSALSLDNLKWMFTTFHAGHYQPLSWLSLALDYQIARLLFPVHPRYPAGLNPLPYHLTNLVLHTVNALLVYALALLLIGRTQAPMRPAGTAGAPGSGHPARAWPWAVPLTAGLAALLLAIHPLRVESVAWATERRDVLSSMLLLLTVLLYLRAHLRQAPGTTDPGPGIGAGRLALIWIVYLLSLLARAMGVTLPLILLLLDWYPLRRLGGAPGRWVGRPVRRVWLEKLPFLAAALVFGIIAPIAQHSAGATELLTTHPLPGRLAQCAYGLFFYLWKTVWPANLAALYELQLPVRILSFKYLGSAALVLTAALTIAWAARRWPALAVAAGCYAILLGPVLGLAQSGPQEVADRYSYLPSVGWSILLAAGVLRLLRSGRLPEWGSAAVTTACVGVLPVLGLLTWRQCQTWRNHGTLWLHAHRAGHASATSWFNLGGWYMEQQDPRQAIDCYIQSLALQPRDPETHYKYGLALHEAGRHDQAIAAFARSLALRPGYAKAHHFWGSSLAALGRWDEALYQYELALQADPGFTAARHVRARTLARLGRWDEALVELQQVVRAEPHNADAWFDLGRVLQELVRPQEAVEAYRAALRAQPAHAGAAINLAVVLQGLGRTEDAVAEYKRALDLHPEHPDLRYNYGNLLLAQGEPTDAIAQFERALRLRPDHFEARVNLGNALALLGRHEEALAAYRQALELRPQNVDVRCNIANRLAALGRRDEAIQVLREGLRLDPTHVEAQRRLDYLLAGGRP